MASHVRLVAVAADDRAGADRLGALLDEQLVHLSYLERCWSRFVPDSDICRINRLSRGGRLVIDEATVVLLRHMVDGVRITEGRFDPTVVRALVRAGYDASVVDGRLAPTIPAPGLPGDHLRPRGVDALAGLVVHDDGLVEVPAGLALDAGGIGKGLAADLVVARLLDGGASGALVAIGGDLAAAGTPPDAAGWVIAIERPDTGEVCCALSIDGGGVATSSTRSRRWTSDGDERHHQIDPATGACATTDVDAVTVVASAGWSAEVHATAALARGADGAIDHLERRGLSGIVFGRRVGGPTVTATADLVDMIAGVPR
ncbi:MAG: FAD:protein FMN transferase [Acidimicrobiales bacterium]